LLSPPYLSPARSGKAFQGNLDPFELFGDAASIRAAVGHMLAGFGGDLPLIGNLGHGMMPGHSPEALRAFFSAVHEISREQRARRAPPA
jgi:uroporphyrinogen decarboxylase